MRQAMLKMGTLGLVIACCVGVCVAPDAVAEGKATLYRDIWGVPHVYADTLPEATYALGYAQAEDRLDDIYRNVRTALGRMAEAFGPEHVEMDYVLRMVQNEQTCREYWEVAPDHIRKACDSFMAGVEAYAAEHPDRKPEFALKLEGWQCAAIGRAMIFQWPLGTLMDDLNNRDEAPGFGSNGFCVAPSRSAEGCAIHMTDPHLTWEGLAVFYEARLHAGDIHHSGFYLAGTPLLALGHNAYVAWACTTGGPDTSDVYMVRLNPKNVMQYDYFGEWKTFEAKVITIDVKDDVSVVRPAFYTEYGPLLDLPDEEKGIAYTGATPYLKATGFFEQVFKMSTSRNCEEFYQALAMNQMMEQNLLFADRDGNIQYVRTGRVPIRPEGDYNWSAPVPGGIEATKWLGIHPIEDLVQIKNPPQGYFQNCNVSPAVMMRDSPLTEEKYARYPYLYNVTWDQDSPRGKRLLQLLDADDSITKEEAMEYTLNIYDLLAEPWQKALREAVYETPATPDAEPKIASAARGKMRNADFAKAVKTILEWDGQFTPDCAAGPLIRYWRLKCEREEGVDIEALADGKPLTPEGQAKLREYLSAAIFEIEKTYGTLDVVWGDINLIGRGGQYFPCPAADFGRGPGKRNHTETVMDVAGRELEKGSGKYVGYNGSSAVMLSFMHKDGIESYSLINWGQSGDPESPHYMDQGEKLYANRIFKPTWFNKADLLQNLESEKEILVP
ncbi:MAG: hypothetical protein GWP08_00380 [Nitrospiraceae bacterium]|nr:hypothetical protein [Nitrospiraceae bacterium]